MAKEGFLLKCHRVQRRLPNKILSIVLAQFATIFYRIQKLCVMDDFFPLKSLLWVFVKSTMKCKSRWFQFLYYPSKFVQEYTICPHIFDVYELVLMK